MTDFTHLHLHTEYSLLDGACRIGDVLARAKELGQTAAAITDHGVMYGVQHFYKEAKKAGVKPIIGCEVYVAPRSRLDKTHTLDGERYHLILLCENETGYQNLLKLVSLSWTEGFYTKPRVDRELLERYANGLICLSGCMFGEVQRLVLSGDIEAAVSAAQWHRHVFGDGNYFLELQDHGTEEDKAVLFGLKKVHEITGIPYAATNDAHYVRKEDAEVQKVLVCIQTNKTVDEDTGLDFQTDSFYLKSADEMAALFADYEGAVANTQKIADRCHLEFVYGDIKLPDFHIDGDVLHRAYLKRLCFDGLTKKFPEGIPAAYSERLDYELSVIEDMGFTDYLLIVADFISHAVNKGIPVGPGRGSAAGSLTAFAAGITGIDPIKNGLLFERFLNPERVSMPDIDIDFCYVRRQEVIEYCIEKYGADRVAQIVTFGTMAARAAVRDTARALGLPYALGDTVAKLIPRELSITLESALKKNAELSALAASDDRVQKLLDMAAKVEGMPRHASTHAAGVVITKNAVSDYVPLAKNDEAVVTQYTMTEIEELGLLKIDFLGLRTLTVVSDAQKLIRAHTPDFSCENLPLDCPEVYAELQKGNTLGVFQCESAGMTNLIVNLKPERFEDIAAAVALYRPGPMFFIDTYLENRKHPEKIKYRTPLLKSILDETCGCMVYQEQVMQTFRTLAGYSFGRADIVRRAMSKKKHDVMEREREIFIQGLIADDGSIAVDGCVRRGIDEETADAVFSDMISFASYGFNKSHTAAYGLIAYRTAYLKVRYPREFMAALLTSLLDDSGKISLYIAECTRLKIAVLPPHINSSFEGFTVEENGIRFGLLAIKNLGRGFIQKIIAERAHSRFTGFEDFCKRLYGQDFNRRALESVIKSGALDGFSINRREMLQSLEILLDMLEREKRQNIDGQLALFSLTEEKAEPAFTFHKLPEMPTPELLNFEKEVTGLYISSHPVEEYAALAKELGCTQIARLTGSSEEPFVMTNTEEHQKVLGIVTKIKKKITKKDDMMAFAQFEDITGSAVLLIFPKILARYAPYIFEGSVLLMDVRVSAREEEDIKLIPETVTPVSELTSAHADKSFQPAQDNRKRRRGLYLKLSERDGDFEKRIKNLISIFEGDLPVWFYYPDEKKYAYLGDALCVDINEPLLNELRCLIGTGNVIFWE